MRYAGVVVFLAGAVALSAPAGVAADTVGSSQEPILLAQVDQGAEEAAEKSKKSKPKRECRRVRVTGSRVKERVCRSPEEWERVDRSVRENVDRAFEGSNRNTTGGDS